MSLPMRTRGAWLLAAAGDEGHGAAERERQLGRHRVARSRRRGCRRCRTGIGRPGATGSWRSFLRGGWSSGPERGRSACTATSRGRVSTTCSPGRPGGSSTSSGRRAGTAPSGGTATYGRTRAGVERGERAEPAPRRRPRTRGGSMRAARPRATTGRPSKTRVSCASRTSRGDAGPRLPPSSRSSGSSRPMFTHLLHGLARRVHRHRLGEGALDLLHAAARARRPGPRRGSLATSATSNPGAGRPMSRGRTGTRFFCVRSRFRVRIDGVIFTTRNAEGHADLARARGGRCARPRVRRPRSIVAPRPCRGRGCG